MATSHTPPLSNNDLKKYLENDLANELHWLMRAAIEWRIQNKIRLAIPGYHMQIFAMDSSFLHSRTLFEFFTKKTTNNHYGYDAYRITMPLASRTPPVVDTVYLSSGWEGALHTYLMHAQDRTIPRRLTSFDGGSTKDIKRMPVDFAQEVVRLWREFAKQLGSSADPDMRRLESVAVKILQNAISQTEDVYKRKKVTAMKRSYSIEKIVW